MKYNKLFLTLSITSVLLALISCNDQENKQPTAQAMPFPVTQIKPLDITTYTEYPTNIEGIVSSDVRAKTSGYVQKVLVDEGQKVKKGQVLFRLETQSLSQDAAAAKAQINVAQVEVNKLKPLVEKNIISPVQLETAKANLAQAQANYSSVNANIGYATVKSPVDGYVGAINYREGALISPTDATPLTTVSDIKQVYAFFSMNESDYLDFIQKAEGKTIQEKVNNFPPILLQLANGEIYSEKGKIQTVTGQINKSTGTVSFRAMFENPNQILTNGNSGIVKIPNLYKDAIVIPKTSTFEQQGSVLVYKLSSENKAISSVLTIQDEIDNLYVIKEGVSKGEKIIAEGVGKLRENTPITPQEIPFDSVAKPIKILFRN